MELMVDTETLGIRPGCVILQIAAVKFNENEIFNEFSSIISIESCQKHALVIETGALKFWMNQPEELRQIMFNGTAKLKEVLYRFMDFVSTSPNARIWSKGANFDIPIIEHTARVIWGYDYNFPWHYRAIRDVRTALDLFGLEVAKDFPGHDGLNDCKNQIVPIQKILKTNKSFEKEFCRCKEPNGQLECPIHGR